MTSTPSAASRQPQLVAELMAAVRPEFRVDVLIPAVGAAIIGGPPCAVVGCGRARLHRGSGLCAAHQGRWRRDFPDLDLAIYVATTPPRFRGDGRLVPCVVPVCRRPTTAHGLCIRHSHAWQRAGRPALADWVATVPAEADVPASCRLPSCGLWTTNGRKPLCRTHMQRWRDWQRRTGGQALEDFLSDCELRGVVHRFDFRPLPPRLKLELQYAVQHRVDDRRAMIEPRPAAYVLRFLAQCGATSLLDWPERAWEAAFQAWAPVGVGRRRNSNAHGFLRYAYRCVQDLAAGYGWEAEYPRDQWDLRRLGINGRTRWLRFHRIPQPWLRELVKRYARWKLTSGASDQAVQRCVQILSWFAEFLARPTVQVESLAALSRDALERYAAEVRALPYSARSRAGYVGAVQGFLLAIRQHRWDATLPGEALFYPEDYPRRPRLLPRALDEFVMAQIEHPDNLARLTDPTVRLATLILINTGLRIGDAAGLAFDCVVHDGQGAPYLRYYNGKMKREALVPIDDDLLAEIHAQQQRLLERWPQPTVLLPRHTANPDGRLPLGQSTYRRQLHQWLATCDIRDQPGGKGMRVRVTPHQFRHTLGTRLVNNNVPLEVVRVILDHESLEMSGHYARLKDQTIRKHWERARKINCQGEDVIIEPDSPLADAQWVKHRVGLAKQALPNGYCGLPIQKRCPHANACHVCPVFVTTPEFLPQHREHREQTRRLLETATAKGQLRMVEMNQQVLANLDRIITKLEAGEDPQASLDASLEEVTDAG